MMAATHAYIGRKPCGCVVAACVDDESDRAESARFTARLIRQGMTVERRETTWVRDNLKGCRCAPSQRSLPKDER